MKQAVKEEFQINLDSYEKMKLIVQAYTNKRKCCVQDYVYHVLKACGWEKFSLVLYLPTLMSQRKDLEYSQLRMRWLSDRMIQHKYLDQNIWLPKFCLFWRKYAEWPDDSR